MDINEFGKLENKIKNIVSNYMKLKEENQVLKREFENLKKNKEEDDKERTEIKEKIKSLIEIIDSIEKE